MISSPTRRSQADFGRPPPRPTCSWLRHSLGVFTVQSLVPGFTKQPLAKQPCVLGVHFQVDAADPLPPTTSDAANVAARAASSGSSDDAEPSSPPASPSPSPPITPFVVNAGERRLDTVVTEHVFAASHRVDATALVTVEVVTAGDNAIRITPLFLRVSPGGWGASQPTSGTEAADSRSQLDAAAAPPTGAAAQPPPLPPAPTSPLAFCSKKLGVCRLTSNLQFPAIIRHVSTDELFQYVLFTFNRKPSSSGGGAGGGGSTAAGMDLTSSPLPSDPGSTGSGGNHGLYSTPKLLLRESGNDRIAFDDIYSRENEPVPLHASHLITLSGEIVFALRHPCSRTMYNFSVLRVRLKPKGIIQTLGNFFSSRYKMHGFGASYREVEVADSIPVERTYQPPLIQRTPSGQSTHSPGGRSSIRFATAEPPTAMLRQGAPSGASSQPPSSSTFLLVIRAHRPEASTAKKIARANITFCSTAGGGGAFNAHITDTNLPGWSLSSSVATDRGPSAGGGSGELSLPALDVVRWILKRIDGSAAAAVGGGGAATPLSPLAHAGGMPPPPSATSTSFFPVGSGAPPPTALSTASPGDNTVFSCCLLMRWTHAERQLSLWCLRNDVNHTDAEAVRFELLNLSKLSKAVVVGGGGGGGGAAAGVTLNGTAASQPAAGGGMAATGVELQQLILASDEHLVSAQLLHYNELHLVVLVLRYSAPPSASSTAAVKPSSDGLLCELKLSCYFYSVALTKSQRSCEVIPLFQRHITHPFDQFSSGHSGTAAVASDYAAATASDRQQISLLLDATKPGRRLVPDRQERHVVHELCMTNSSGVPNSAVPVIFQQFQPLDQHSAIAVDFNWRNIWTVVGDVLAEYAGNYAAAGGRPQWNLLSYARALQLGRSDEAAQLGAGVPSSLKQLMGALRLACRMSPPLPPDVVTIVSRLRERLSDVGAGAAIDETVHLDLKRALVGSDVGHMVFGPVAAALARFFDSCVEWNAMAAPSQQQQQQLAGGGAAGDDGQPSVGWFLNAQQRINWLCHEELGCILLASVAWIPDPLGVADIGGGAAPSRSVLDIALEVLNGYAFSGQAFKRRLPMVRPSTPEHVHVAASCSSMYHLKQVEQDAAVTALLGVSLRRAALSVATIARGIMSELPTPLAPAGQTRRSNTSAGAAAVPSTAPATQVSTSAVLPTLSRQPSAVGRREK